MIIQLHRGGAAQWAADNPVLAYGEPGWDKDNRILKIGDGVTPWASLPAFSSGGGAPSSGAYPLSAYGFHSASGDPATFTGNSTFSPGAFWAHVFVPAGKAITVVATAVKTAGTLAAGGRNGFAVYDDTGTQLGTTVDDNNLWLATGWVIKALPSPIPASGTDRYVWAAAGYNGYSVSPVIAFLTDGVPQMMTGGGYNVPNHRRSFYDTSTAWPASINPAVYGTDPGGYLPLITLG